MKGHFKYPSLRSMHLCNVSSSVYVELMFGSFPKNGLAQSLIDNVTQ